MKMLFRKSTLLTLLLVSSIATTVVTSQEQADQKQRDVLEAKRLFYSFLTAYEQRDWEYVRECSTVAFRDFINASLIWSSELSEYSNEQLEELLNRHFDESRFGNAGEAKTTEEFVKAFSQAIEQPEDLFIEGLRAAKFPKKYIQLHETSIDELTLSDWTTVDNEVHITMALERVAWIEREANKGAETHKMKTVEVDITLKRVDGKLLVHMIELR